MLPLRNCRGVPAGQLQHPHYILEVDQLHGHELSYLWSSK